MSFVEKIKEYPPALWAMALYLASLGFNFKADVPLAILAITSILAFGQLNSSVHIKSIIRDHWHIIFFLVLSLAATLCSGDIGHSIHVQVQLVPALLMYAIIATFVVNERQFNFVMVAIVFGGLITAITFLMQAAYLTGMPDPLEKVHHIRSPLFVAPNDILFLSIIVPLALCIFMDSKSVIIKNCAICYLAATLAAAIYMQSRQATGVILLAAFFFFFLLKPIHGVVIVFIGSLAILAIDWMQGQVLMHKLVHLFPRRYVWEAAWQMFIDRPLVGQGPGMFKEYYQTFLGKAGYALEQVEDRRPMNWAHSLYLEQLAERGMAGMLGLLVLVGKPLVPLLKNHNQLTLREKCLLATLFAYLFAGIAETSFLRLWAVVLIFLLLGLFSSYAKVKRLLGE